MSAVRGTPLATSKMSAIEETALRTITLRGASQSKEPNKPFLPAQSLILLIGNQDILKLIENDRQHLNTVTVRSKPKKK